MFNPNHALINIKIKKQINVNVNVNEFIEFIVTLIINNNYIFQKLHYVTMLIKKTRDEKIVYCCLNINCFFTIENRVYVKRIFFISIRQLIVFLSMRKIENNIYNFNEYIVVNLFINNYVIIVEKKH